MTYELGVHIQVWVGDSGEVYQIYYRIILLIVAISRSAHPFCVRRNLPTPSQRKQKV